MLNAKERSVRAVVEVHGLHGTLHALVEVCYRKAERLEGELEPVEDRMIATRADNWRRIGRLLTAIEAEASGMEF